MGESGGGAPGLEGAAEAAPSSMHGAMPECGPPAEGGAFAPQSRRAGSAAPAGAVGTIGAGSAAPAHVVIDFDASQNGRRLVGMPVWFEFEQDGAGHVAFGHVTSVRASAAPGGAGEGAGGRAQSGTMTVGAVFPRSDCARGPLVLGTLPAAGAVVREADDALVRGMVGERADVSYIGRFCGAAAGFPARLPPFGASGPPGVGPYSIGVYGARGSGKSALARGLIAAFSRSPGASIFVIDMDGDLSGEGGGGGPNAGSRLRDACGRAGKRFLSYGAGDLVLDRWDLFYEVLRESDMVRALLPEADRRDVFMGMVRAKFRTGGGHTMAGLRGRDAFDSMMDLLGGEANQEEIYPAERHVRALFARRVEKLRSGKAYDAHWLPLAGLFSGEGRRKVSGLIRHACEEGENRPVIAVSLSRRTAPDGLLWNDGVRAIVARRIMREIAAHGENRYGRGGRLGMLAVICSAESVAPRRAPTDQRLAGLRDAAVDLAHSSRRYGLGLMFVADTLARLHPALYTGNLLSFYGSGLTAAAEEDAMSGVLPAGFAALYKALVRRDWQGAAAAAGGGGGLRAAGGGGNAAGGEPARASYPFMSGGHATPLSTAGEPMFFTVDAPA